MTTAAATITGAPPTLDEIRTTAPQVPVTLEQTGLTTDMVEQLLVKTLYGGELTGLMLADRLRLPRTASSIEHIKTSPSIGFLR